MSTVLVIGASRGLGLELATQYAAAGWRVIGTARTPEGLSRLQAVGAEALSLDVSNPASVSGLSWRLDGEKLDLALYVAGVMDKADAQTPPTREAFDAVMHANVLGAMQVIPQIAPMLQEGHGTLACISSRMGSLALTQSSDAALYRISKAALNMVVRTAQAGYADIAVVALHPGWVQTDMGGRAAPLTPRESVTAMRATLASLKPAHHGQFLSYDGTPLAW
jgi:NAD(P)-dependent dehydrogenase (short-subunit alcohol dehydrogenase family)